MFDALAGGSPNAADTAQLFWVMTVGCAAVWSVAAVIAWHASRSARAQWSERAGLWMVIAGGVIAPVVALTALFAYGMPLLARHGELPDADVRVTVVGEQWWWRVSYELPDGTRVALANELRLPHGRIARLSLTSTNVIHSFWMPSLAGKMDMIPGRVTTLSVAPNRIGVFDGMCAEYCGASHARMAFKIEVMEPGDFDVWLSSQAAPASAEDGEAAFMMHGCAACHAIRGTAATATIGPDLTHVGSRHTIAAALPNRRDEMVRWLAAPREVKPGALMPPFGALNASELQRLAVYMSALR